MESEPSQTGEADINKEQSIRQNEDIEEEGHPSFV